MGVGTDPENQCATCQVCNGNGACTSAGLGTDPKSECATDAPTSCGLTGSCDGSGSCEYYDNSQECVTESCTGTTHQFADKCSGTGSCTDGGQEDCSPYVCTGTTCGTSCSAQSDCISGYYCELGSGTCLSKKPDGQSCGNTFECASDHCQNGFCCASGNCCATTANCTAFQVAPSCTSASGCDGERTDASCNGNFQCVTTVVDDDTACANSVCVASTCDATGSLQFIAAKRCNSSGQCNQGGSVTSCGDGNLCTDDVCDNTSGCSNPNNSATQGCYTGPPATQNVGNCTDGVQTCSGGSFGGCANEVVPSGESCGGGDEDCDGVVDEENASGCTTYYYDNDGDSFGIAGDTKCLCTASGKYTATQAGDCNDGDSAVNPGATEACNSIDDDCDNATDEENATSCSTYYFDGDDDNYGTSASKCLCSGAGDYTTQNTGDCNDSEPMVNPAAPEFCNGIDDNCSSVTDEGFNLVAVCDGGVDADKCQEGTLQCDPLDPSRATLERRCELDCDGRSLRQLERFAGAVNEAKTGSTGTGGGTLTTASGHDGSMASCVGGWYGDLYLVDLHPVCDVREDV